MSDTTAVETAPVVEPVAEEDSSIFKLPSDLDIDRDEILYGLASLAGFIQGYMMYANYPKWVKDENTMFPDRDPNPSTYTNNENEEWALGTKEIRAWRNSSYVNLAWYGVNLLAWGFNLGFDNEGGRLHYVSQSLRRLTWFALLTQIAFAVNVNVAYVRTAYWFQEAVKDGDNVGSAQVPTDERMWLFNPGNVTPNEFDSRDQDRQSNEQQNWISIILIAGVMSTVFSPLSDKYKEASYARELAAWEEIYGEPKEESASTEDAAPAEEQFF